MRTFNVLFFLVGSVFSLVLLVTSPLHSAQAGKCEPGSAGCPATNTANSNPWLGSVPIPASPAIYWGVFIHGVPWDMSKLDALEQATNRKVSIVHFGLSWRLDGNYVSFPKTEMDKIRAHDAMPMVNWGSWDYSLGMTQTDFTLSRISVGIYDNFIRQWARDAKAWGYPFFLRFDHEMNGWWQFPWAEQANNNRPGDYIKMWRHVHNIFVEEGATNVTWVWCPNVIGYGTTPLAQVYPGDSYVDWVGMDGYNWGTPWRSFSEVFSDTYNALQELAPTKPILIGETASTEQNGSKAAWITDALGTQLPLYFPNVKALAWFNWNDDDLQKTWPIESSPASVAAFKLQINTSTNYYATSPTQIVCSAEQAARVTHPTDSGIGNFCGTLSYALKNVASGVIDFKISPAPALTFTDKLAVGIELKSGVAMSGGSCGSAPPVTINGANLAGNNLILKGSNSLNNLYLKGFLDKLTVLGTLGNLPGQNSFQCVRISRLN